MLYILETELLEKKKVAYALSKIFGVGPTLAKKLLNKLGLSPQALIGELDEDNLDTLKGFGSNFMKIGLELKTVQKYNIKKKLESKTFEGLRHFYGLPVNGQRTRHRGKTAKYLSRSTKNLIKVNVNAKMVNKK